MNRARLLTLASAIVFVAASVPMALRIRDYNQSAHLVSYHADAYASRTVRLTGFPQLTIEDHVPTPADGATSPDAFFLKLIYGDPSNPTVKLVPVRKPPAPNLPKLDIYDEWAKLLSINEVQRDAAGKPSAKPGTERLILVVRRTPEGFDSESWGSVRRTEWLFDYHEFKPDGTIKTETRRWPMASERYEQQFQARVHPTDDKAPPPSPRLVELAAIPPIAERSVEYFMAMHVIPKLNVPKYKFNDTAFSFHTLGWTLPVVMLSGLVFSVAVFFAFAPLRKVSAKP